MQKLSVLFVLFLLPLAPAEELCDYFYNQSDDCAYVEKSQDLETDLGILTLLRPMIEALSSLLEPPEEEYSTLAVPCFFVTEQYERDPECDGGHLCESRCADICESWGYPVDGYDDYYDDCTCICTCEFYSGCDTCGSNLVDHCYDVTELSTCQNSYILEGDEPVKCYGNVYEDEGEYVLDECADVGWSCDASCFLSGTKILVVD